MFKVMATLTMWGMMSALAYADAIDPCGTKSLPGEFEACHGTVWSVEVWDRSTPATAASYVVLSDPNCTAPPKGVLFIGVPEDGISFSAKVASVSAALTSNTPIFLVYEKAMRGGGHRVVRIDVPAKAVCGVEATTPIKLTPRPKPSTPSSWADPMSR